ncbi:MAG: NUDIX hydrolase [Alphaproteobacteria bacterium]|nr:NUDIX hydrolase [Alphaproteobacteria bacterium]MBL6936601.1 NUDIX hydrolase [Alphaproteobacteria bacterium]MBL7098348.1 NUDIX hydrolase [Alphaproteobacteria bacterium]
MRTNTAIARSVATKPRADQQVAALPFRVTEAGLEVMLITSRRTRRWIVPKGWPEPGSSPAADAAREALEEAGISGEIAPKPLGAFHYLKERKHSDGTNCRVNLYPLKVTRQRRTWPEKASRETKWLRYAEAAALVAEPELKRLILKFGAQHVPAAA